MEDRLIHLSLFSGIGGIDLAAEWAGFKTIAFVECDKYCQKVLNKHWPSVPIISDIRDVNIDTIGVRDVTREKIMAYTESKRINREYGDNKVATTENRCRMHESNSRGNQTRDKERAIPPITLITGGVPCQPASVAGKRRGTKDDRWLWPEALRILSEIKPTWAVFENPTGILTLEDGVVFNNLLSQMEAEGYEVQPIIIPACAVNAPHRRDRCFIVGYSKLYARGNVCREQCRTEAYPVISQRSKDVPNPTSERLEGNRPELSQRRHNELAQFNNKSREEETMGNTMLRRQPRSGKLINTSNTAKNREGETNQSINECIRNQWAVEPELGRVAHGIPHRVDRLRCLGNAVVPQQVYPILKAIAEWEY